MVDVREKLKPGWMQVVRATGGQRGQRVTPVVRELRLRPRPPVGLEHLEAVEVELVDELANVVLAHQSDDADLRRSEPLGRGEDDLSPFHLDGVLAVADDASEPVALVIRDRADSNHHAQGQGGSPESTVAPDPEQPRRPLHWRTGTGRRRRLRVEPVRARLLALRRAPASGTRYLVAIGVGGTLP